MKIHNKQFDLLTELGIFLITPLIIHGVGVKLYDHLSANNNGVGEGVAILITFLVCIAGTAVVQELWYRIVELPSRTFERAAWRWMTCAV